MAETYGEAAAAGSISAQLIAHVLRDLGHDAPTGLEMEELIQRASDRVKEDQGLDPRAVEFKLVPVGKEWMQEYLSFVSKRD